MPRVARAPYSISYLFPAPAKIARPHGGSSFDPEYVTRVRHVFDGLLTQRAKAAFYGLHYQIVGLHPELEGLLYNAPPHWDDKTLTATEVDGSVIEHYRDPDAVGE